MEKTVSDFASKHRIAVLTTLIDQDTPHSASMHYAFSTDEGSFMFFTEQKSTKCKGLNDSLKHPASMVIGFSEEEFIELQMRGEISIVKDSKDLESAWKVYGDKFPNMLKWKDSKDDVLLKFVPLWWRYSEFKPKFKSIESK